LAIRKQQFSRFYGSYTERYGCGFESYAPDQARRILAAERLSGRQHNAAYSAGCSAY